MAAEDAPRFSAWFANDGGPLIVLPRELLSYWEGGDSPTDDSTIESPCGSNTPFEDLDYDRACSVETIDSDHALGVLAVGSGIGLVLSSGLPVEGASWLQYSGQPGALLIVPVCAEVDVEPLLVQAVQQLTEAAWKPLYPAVHVESGDLVLFHAACPGDGVEEYIGREDSGKECAVIGQSITCHVDPGVYIIESCSLDLSTSDGSSHCVLGRFRPAG